MNQALPPFCSSTLTCLGHLRFMQAFLASTRNAVVLPHDVASCFLLAATCSNSQKQSTVCARHSAKAQRRCDSLIAGMRNPGVAGFQSRALSAFGNQPIQALGKECETEQTCAQMTRSLWRFLCSSLSSTTMTQTARRPHK